MKVRGDFLGPPRSTDKTTLIFKVSKGAKIRNRYNQVSHLKINFSVFKSYSVLVVLLLQLLSR